MKRYSTTQQLTRFDGKKTLSCTYYPEIPISDSDIYVISNDTDFLDNLSYRFYKDPSLFWIIALANPGIGKGRLSVESGLQIRIPGNIANILSDFEKINS